MTETRVSYLIDPDHLRERTISDKDLRLTLDILETVRQHRGPEHAITAKQIGMLHSISWRKAAAIIALLRDKHNPIGSSRSKPKGFFWVTCPEEGQATLHRYDSIIRTLSQERRRMAESFKAAFGTSFQQPMY